MKDLCIRLNFLARPHQKAEFYLILVHLLHFGRSRPRYLDLDLIGLSYVCTPNTVNLPSRCDALMVHLPLYHKFQGNLALVYYSTRYPDLWEKH